MKEMSLDQKIDRLSQEMHRGFAAVKTGLEEARKDRARIRLEMKEGFDDARRDRSQIRDELKDQVEGLARTAKCGFDEQGAKSDRIMRVEITQLKQRVTLIEQAFALGK